MLNSPRPGDLSNRRRRNIILSSDNNGEIAAGINWPSDSDSPPYEFACDEQELTEYEDQMEYDFEEYEEDHNPEIGEADRLEKDTGLMMIGNKPINLDKFKVNKQQHSMEKVTIYLDKNLMCILKILKKNKSITSYSQCIAEALEEYLT